MIISVPRERKANELRVALTPEHAKTLVKAGHKVLIETMAGSACGFEDQDYLDSACEIRDSLEILWKEAEILLKVKEPAKEEYPFLRKDLIVFSFLHPAASRELTDVLVNSGVTGIDFDLIKNELGSFAILSPMSSLAGTLSVYLGVQHLFSHEGGNGIILGSTLESAPKVSVLILGGGVAGESALSLAYRMGASITLIDINKERLTFIANKYPGVKTSLCSATNIEKELPHTDLIIGAALVAGARAPTLLSRSALRLCKKGSVLVDIAIDQGGIAETSRTTSIENPSYVEEGVTHICIPNMPSMLAQTATSALSDAHLPYLLKIAELAATNRLLESETIRNSIVSFHGKLCNEAIAKSFGLEFVAARDISAN